MTQGTDDLPMGWQKVRKYRRRCFGKKRKWDNVFISPDGLRFRSRVQLDLFLQSEVKVRSDPLSSIDVSLKNNNKKLTCVKPRSLKEKIFIVDAMRSFNSCHEDVYDPQLKGGIHDEQLLHSNFSSTESLAGDLLEENDDLEGLDVQNLPVPEVVKEDTPVKFKSWLASEPFCPNNNYNHWRFLHKKMKDKGKSSCSLVGSFQSLDLNIGYQERFKENVKIVQENEVDTTEDVTDMCDEEIEEYFSDCHN